MYLLEVIVVKITSCIETTGRIPESRETRSKKKGLWKYKRKC